MSTLKDEMTWDESVWDETTWDETTWDVIVIGAGMAGLTCARQLQQTGQQVLVLEKSRGVGGRMATRRLHGTLADHGTCYLSTKDTRFRTLLEPLIETGVVRVWTDVVHDLNGVGQVQAPIATRYPRYVAPDGMTAIAKALAQDLHLERGQRVEAIREMDQCWQLLTVPVDPSAPQRQWRARAVVVAIPAPQALILLQPLTEGLSIEFIQQLQSIRFLPCLSVMAGYPAICQSDWQQRFPTVQAITFPVESDLGWLGLDSSKRSAPVQPVFVVQSSAAFADRYLEATDLQTVGHQLLRSAADLLAPWLATPEWLQVHRWRYAFVQSPLEAVYLAATSSIPLVCTGDWCGGRKVEDAYRSGLAAAEYVISQL